MAVVRLVFVAAFQIALKIIRNKKRFQHQAAVEVRILEVLKQNDASNNYNIVQMIRYFTFRNHICIVFELLG